MLSECKYHFSPDRKSWRNNSADGATEILRDPNFAQVKLPETLSKLADAGWDFPNIRFAMHYMALAHDGAHHAYLRKLSAQHIKSVSSQLPKVLPKVLELMQDRFQQDGELELMSEVVFPMVGKIIKTLSGLDYDRNTSLAIRQEFSLKKLNQQEHNFGKMKAQAERRFPNAGPAEIGIRMSFVSVGLEPLAGTLGTAFDHIFEGAELSKICDLDWPDYFPTTGVPNVVRVAKDGKDINIENSGKGIRVLELDMDRYFDVSDKSAQMGIFGFGRHSCIGKAISILLWKGIVKIMKENDARITYLGHAPSTHNVFNVPNSVRVKISHDA